MTRSSTRSRVQNTGATTLTDVTITDAKLGLARFACSPGPLAPGATVTCLSTAVYPLTQADIDAGSVLNTATATATAPAGTDPSDSDDETRLVDRVSGIDIVKTVGAPTVAKGLLPNRTDAGDTVVYTFAVQNTSNVTLDGRDRHRPDARLRERRDRLPRNDTRTRGDDDVHLRGIRPDAG